MNCYTAEIRLYGEYEASDDTRDWRDPEHMSHIVKTSQDVSVCIYAENKERAEEMAKEWRVPSKESRCQLDYIYRDKTVILSLTLVEEDCDVEMEGYDPESDEYEVLYAD